MENIEQSQEKKLTTISSLIAQIQNDANNYLDSQLKKIGLSEITTSHGFILFVLSQNKNISSLGIFIGPEGGFASKEIEFLKSLGGKTVTLGNRILRTETAGQAVLSAIMYEFDEMQ